MTTVGVIGIIALWSFAALQIAQEITRWHKFHTEITKKIEDD